MSDDTVAEDNPVSVYEKVLADARAFGEDKCPHAPEEHHTLFAKAVAYLVTGERRGFTDQPAGREQRCLTLIKPRNDIGNVDPDPVEAVAKACRVLRSVCYTPNITVHRLGTPTHGGAKRLVLDVVVMEQIRLANRLRNTLVEISKEADDARDAVDTAFPDVAVAEAALEKAKWAITDIKETISEAKRVQRTRSPNTKANKALEDARKAARTCREAVVAAKKRVQVEAKPEKDKIAALEKERVKALYPQYRELGLYWAVINDVCDHHRTARARIIALRKQGRSAGFRYHRFTGKGALAVQLQREKGKPRRSPELLASGEGPYRSRLTTGLWMPPEEWNALPRAERRKLARSRITLRVGDEQVEVPAIIHRMLPREADVTGARLVVRRVAADTHYSVSITAIIPDPQPRTSGPMIALHGGWRREDDDAIRVATWRSTEPVTIPDSVADVVRAESPTSGIVVLPAAWRPGLARPDHIRSQRDLLLDPMRAQLVAWLKKHPPTDEEDPATAARVAQWRSPDRFANLALRWRTTPPPGGEEIAAALEAWRCADKKLWQRQEHGRAKALGRRTDGWRRVAAWIASIAGVLVVDDTDLAALTTTITAKTADDPTPVAVTSIAARQRVDAAPGDLRTSAIAAATREGVPVVEVSSQNLTREHTCGHILTDEPTTRPILCHGCNHYYDPDQSGTLLMLMRAESQLAAA